MINRLFNYLSLISEGGSYKSSLFLTLTIQYIPLSILIMTLIGCAHIQRDIYMDDIEYEQVIRQKQAREEAAENKEKQSIPTQPVEKIRAVDDWDDYTTQTKPKVLPKQAVSSKTIKSIPAPPTVRHYIKVGLSINKKKHLLHFTHPTTVRIYKNGQWAKKLTINGVVTLKRKNKSIVLSHNGRSYYTFDPIQFVSSNPDSPTVIDRENRYRGHFEVHMNGKNLILINELNIEEYLRGVLPHEMGKRKQPHFEALKAQAISARTYTYKHLNSRKSYHFDVFADVRDQMYKGATGEYALSDKAVKSTEGVVIQYKGTLIDSYYHSTCGGKTASIHKVWPNSKPIPYLVSMNDMDETGKPWCNQSTYVTWSRSWKKRDLVKMCSKNLKRLKPTMHKFSSIDRLEIMGWTPSGRITELRLETNSGRHTTTSDKSRWVLRQPNSDKLLMSSCFKLYKKGSTYTAKGKGYGHGIGFCQMGAMSRSSAGQSFRQIILAYYKNTELIRYR